jgi:rhamnosyl/mannosyltransferase
VFTLPATQRSEAFGLVQLEAMSCGKPVVSTDLGTGTSFVNCHRQTGVVVPPNDPAVLATALRELLNSPEKRKIYGQNGFNRVQTHFHVKKMVESTIDIYRQVLCKA